MTSETVSNTPNGETKLEPDWIRIEIDYRAGIKPLRVIAAEHGITHGAVNKRAKRDDWTRDLNGKIQAKADALVSRTVVSAEVSKKKLVTEKEVVDANATNVAAVQIRHRNQIGRTAEMTVKLLSELEDSSLPVKLDGGLIGPPPISMAVRAGVLKSLTESLRVTVALEREAYGINAGAMNPDDAMTSMLTRLQGTAKTITPIADDIDLLPAP